MLKKGPLFYILFILFTILAPATLTHALPEFRGVWIDVRSIPNTRDGIEAMVKELASAHFNAILVESFYLGKTIYPSDFLAQQGLTSQMEVYEQTNLDPLAAFIESAHSYNMQVHAWFDMFYVGLNQPGELLEKFPAWQSIQRDGTVGYTQGKNHFYWACPLHQGVKEFYIGLLIEVLQNYDLDGIHLDYLRFPDTTIADTCYAQEHREHFLSQYGVDPIAIDPFTQPDVYRLWNSYRAQSVTGLLAEINTRVHQIKPDIILSVAVQPRGMPIELNPGFLQNWPFWTENHYLDVLIPMTYSSRVNEMKGLTYWVNTFLLGNLPAFAGIQAFNLPDIKNLSQMVEFSRLAQFQGSVIFAYPYLNSEILDSLKQGPFQEKAEAPSRKYLNSLVPVEKVQVVQYSHPNPRTIKAQLIHEVIQVDGLLHEKSWEKADFQNEFSLITGEGLASSQTTVACLFSPTYLYIMFQVDDSPEQNRKITIYQKDGPVFYDDSVEVFIDPWFSSSFYYHLSLNSIGTQYDSFSRTGPSWNANWEVAIQEKTSGWTVEIAIPFSELEIQSPHPGEQWGINFNRTDIILGEFSGWSPTPGTFHAPSFFGILEFEK